MYRAALGFLGLFSGTPTAAPALPGRIRRKSQSGFLSLVSDRCLILREAKKVIRQKFLGNSLNAAPR